MKILCSYCRKDLGEKEPLDDPSLSHGMCDECFEYYLRQWKGLDLGRYLDRFDKPVVAVDGAGRVVALNTPMAHMLSKDQAETIGRLGGEVMECQYARLADGCGKTVHCKSCTIRRTVDKTVETGQAQVCVPAHLDKKDGTIAFTISTELKDDMVLLVIEEMKEE